ncbi:multicopper oxidase domain-containing protein [Streptomyces composti]|uniref:multicopper oxidase domain-containing protein n=1 Tax=Streptomyces composti TaxID=2720025 RepID=UPI00281226E0|nr:multicopper oxidase domain-containing protein [Streptomyces composti]
MRVSNTLGEPSTVHWHGMHLPARMDGGPHQMVAPGATWTPHWKIDQPAATLVPPASARPDRAPCTTPSGGPVPPGRRHLRAAAAAQALRRGRSAGRRAGRPLRRIPAGRRPGPVAERRLPR